MKSTLVIIGIVFSASSFANSQTTSCGKVKANLFTYTPNKAPLVIISHNGHEIKKSKLLSQDFAMYRGKTIPAVNTFYLSPGYHEFSAIAVETAATITERNGVRFSKKMSTINKLSGSSLSDIKAYRPIGGKYNIINFALNVESNKIYRLIAQKSSSSKLFDSVAIASIKNSTCDNKKPIPAKPQQHLVNFESNLPMALQLRIDALTKDITDHYSKNGQAANSINLLLPKRKESHFGLILDLNSNINEGLLIEGITPRTFAEKIGLKVNDRIISFNGTSIINSKDSHTAVVQLQQLLKEIQSESEVNIEVVRDNEKKTLSTTYLKTILPEVRATIG